MGTSLEAVASERLDTLLEKIERARDAFCVSTVEIGRLLNEAAGLFIDQSEFVAWVDRSLGWSERAVRRYRAIAARFGSHDDRLLSHIDVHALERLATAPREVVTIAIDAASSERRVAPTDVKAWLEDRKNRSQSNGAKKPAAKAGPKKGAAPKEPEAKVATGVKDGFGNDVPKELVHIFAGQPVERAKAIETLLRQAKRVIKELGESDAGQCQGTATILKDLAAVAHGVEVAKPFCLCPRCSGDEVPARCACRGRGWLPRTLYDRLPAEHRIWGPSK